jgi:hypothetical protein
MLALRSMYGLMSHHTAVTVLASSCAERNIIAGFW